MTKWYRKGFGDITVIDVIKETDKMLIYKDDRGRERREHKKTSYSAWYPSLRALLEADVEKATKRVEYAKNEAERAETSLAKAKALLAELDKAEG